MSIEAMKWAMDEAEARELPMALRYLLLMLANAADHAGGNLFPSHGHLSKRTGMAKSTIRAHIGELERIGLLAKKPRKRAHDGSQTSNMYQLAMAQVGLDLEDDRYTPPARFQQGGDAGLSAPPVPAATSTRELGEVKGRKAKAGGQGKPSPVAALFKAYQDGIRRLYGAEYPPSAKANGQLAGVVKTLGAAPAARSLDFYLARQKPYYATRKHALDVFVKDASDLWIEAQQVTGGSAARPAPVKAIAYLEHYDGDGPVRMAEYPAGDPLDIAKVFAREYASKVERTSVSCVMIRQGAAERRYKPEELR